MIKENERPITVYLDKEVAQKLKAKCAIENKSMTALLRDFIYRYLGIKRV